MLFQNFCQNLDKLLLKLDKLNVVAIALSGGCDSIALLQLASFWAKDKEISIVALTVDHKLRSNSTREAEEVAAYCRKINIKHHILTWQHQEIKANIQENARIARYELITNWCKENSASAVLTGHHLGDQVEQFLISLSQGAGIYSFNIPRHSVVNGVNFFRPLLEIKKEALISYLQNQNISWWEDYTNEENKYLRNSLRNIAEKFLKQVDQKRIVTSFSNIERASKALTLMSKKYFDDLVSISEMGYAHFSVEAYAALEEEIRFSILRQALIIIGRRDSDIRLSSLLTLDDAIKNSIPKTLAGCAILTNKEKCIIFREFGRKQLETLEVSKGAIWDNRYKITTNKPITILNIKEDTLNKLLKVKPELLNFDDQLPKNIRKSIILTLPAIWLLEKLVTIPHIYYYDEEKQNTEYKIEFLNSLL